MVSVKYSVVVVERYLDTFSGSATALEERRELPAVSHTVISTCCTASQLAATHCVGGNTVSGACSGERERREEKRREREEKGRKHPTHNLWDPPFSTISTALLPTMQPLTPLLKLLNYRHTETGTQHEVYFGCDKSRRPRGSFSWLCLFLSVCW